MTMASLTQPLPMPMEINPGTCSVMSTLTLFFEQLMQLLLCHLLLLVMQPWGSCQRGQAHLRVVNRDSQPLTLSSAH